MISDPIEPRRRDQRRKLRHKLQRLEYHARGSVAPAAPELVQEFAVGQERQPLDSYRWARSVAAQSLEPNPVVRRNTDSCVQIETGHARTAGNARVRPFWVRLTSVSNKTASRIWVQRAAWPQVLQAVKWALQ